MELVVVVEFTTFALLPCDKVVGGNPYQFLPSRSEPDKKQHRFTSGLPQGGT